MRSVGVINLGRTDYKGCWDLQQRLFDQRSAGEVGDLLLLTEHDHVYTIGKGGDKNHLLANDEELRSNGVTVYHNDRGGDITFHGPGQLVGYPILDLNNYYLDLHRYLRDLEEVIIRTLAGYGVSASRNADYTGVWVGNDKICAIGVKTSRWITMHGFAFNVNTDLSYFGRIIPCGIFEKGVTSLQQILGRKIDLFDVAARVVEQFSLVFQAYAHDLGRRKLSDEVGSEVLTVVREYESSQSKG
ncbi:MAG TPA: lipoyl(octanoyl) transferase LipB [Bacteroidota bacterium]|nr:lipoyl(octanoyl) transferase LipB [Bacteroidota bacterium]